MNRTTRRRPVKRPEPKEETPSPYPVSSGYKKFRTVFDKMGKPDEPVPAFPKKLSSLTSDQLGDYTSKYAAWREFTEDMHFEALQDKLVLQTKYDFEHAKLMVTAKGDGLNEKKYHTLSNEVLNELRQQLLDADIYLSMVANKLESFNNALSVLSREVSRRGNINA